ncbi:MAG: DUF456 domain-containing protein [Desulfobacterales bacterium]|nr:DUF456 domain-containing protein [Desulfobacterales bacterium]
MDLWLVLAVVLVCIGVAGSVLPALPGVPLVFAGLLLARLGRRLPARLVDHAGRARPADGRFVRHRFRGDRARRQAGRRDQARRRRRARSARSAGVFLGLPGLILGPFVGAVAGEMLSHGKMQQATRAGLATWMGLHLRHARQARARVHDARRVRARLFFERSS